MKTEKLARLYAREKSLHDAIKKEQQQAKVRKQRTLFAAVRRAGLLDITDLEIEAVLKAYHVSHKADDDGAQP